MRPTLTYLTTLTVAGEIVVLAMPVGGGSVEAMSVNAANSGERDGWLEGWPPAETPAPERSAQQERSGGITKTQAQLLIGVIEEEAPLHVLEREDVARAIGALRDVSGLNASLPGRHDETGPMPPYSPLREGREGQI